MEENDVKNSAQKLLGSIVRKVVKVVIPILLVVIILAGACYVIYKKDLEDASKATSSYKETVSVSPSQGITSSIYNDEGDSGAGESGGNDGSGDNAGSEGSGDTGGNAGSGDNGGNGDNSGNEEEEDELIKFFEEHGYDVGKHFNDPDNKVNANNLKKIVNAEFVTQFPYIQGLSSDKVNGVVRFKRIKSSDSGNNEDYDEENPANNIGDVLEDCLTYVAKEQFDAWITQYNSDNNNSEARTNAMKSFTLTEDNEKAVIAVSKSVQVKTNDQDKDVRGELGEYFQNATYTVTADVATGELIYNFEILEPLEVNYKEFIEQYTMPSDLLFALLSYSEDLDFVLEVADLAYNSTILVGIYDSGNSEVTNYKEYTYNKQVKGEITSSVTVPKDLLGSEYVSEVFNNVAQSKLNTKPDKVTESNHEYAGLYSITEKHNLHMSDESSDSYGTEIKYSVEAPLVSDTERNADVLGFLANGNIDISKAPINYYLKYYFYENTPKVDMYIADVWYGYYNKNWYYNNSEPTVEHTETLASTEYIEFNQTSGTWFNQKPDIIAGLEGSIIEYLDSENFKTITRNEYDNYIAYYNTEADSRILVACLGDIVEDAVDNAVKDVVDAVEGVVKDVADTIVNGLESFFDDLLNGGSEENPPQNTITFDEYLNAAKEQTKQAIMSSLNEKTKETETCKTYIRDCNIKQTSYNVLNTEGEKWSSNVVSSENVYFSRILKKHSGAYTSLKSMGEWFIETLSETESTVNILPKVQYLLNKAYDSEDFGSISDDELFSLYITNSVNVNIPTNGAFTATAKACHDFLRVNNYYYSSAANKEAGNYVKDGPSTGGKVQIVYGAPQSERYTDCSAYVTWVLMQTGHLSLDNTYQRNSYWLYSNGRTLDGISEEIFSSREDMENFFDGVITSNEGYILVKEGHTEIFAGIETEIVGEVEKKYYCTYNAGSTSSIRKEKSRYTEDQFFNHFNWSDYKVLIVE